MFRLILFLAFLFLFTDSNYAYNSFLKVRPFTTLGYTAGENVNVGNGSLLSYRIGIQPLYQLTRYFAIGADIGYIHSYKTSYDSSSHSDSQSKFTKAAFLHTNVVADFSFYNNTFVIQGGIGPYFGAADNSSETAIGFFLASGFDIPLFNSRVVSMPIMARFEFILGEYDLAPITMFTGLTFKFK